MAQRFALIAGNEVDTLLVDPQRDALIARFQSCSTISGFHCEPGILNRAKVIRRLKPSVQPAAKDEILLLILAGGNLSQMHSFVADILQGPHTVLPIVLVPDDLYTGHSVIHLIHNRGALCVMTSTVEPAEFEASLRQVACGKYPFTRFFPGLTLSSRIAFVVTPYRTGADRDYWAGIQCGLDPLGIKPMLANERMTRPDVLENELAAIVESGLILVNQSTYGEPPNANVYFEHGYVHAIKKPAIVLMQTMPSQPPPEPPVNVKGLFRLLYSSPGDLAQKLYCGLRHLA